MVINYEGYLMKYKQMKDNVKLLTKIMGFINDQQKQRVS